MSGSEFREGLPAQTAGALLRRWRRRVLVVAGALLLYSLAGFLLVPALIVHYAPAMLRESLGLEASVGELRVNPFALTLEARAIRVDEPGGAALAKLSRLFVDFELSSITRRAWTFTEVRVEQPELDLVLEADGRLNLERLLASLPAPAPAPEAANDAPPPRVLVLQGEVPGARLRYTDQRPGYAASLEIGPVDLSIDEIATLQSHRGPYRLEAALPGGATLIWSGTGGLHPPVSDGTLQLHGFEPAVLWPFLQPAVRLKPPGGRVDATFSYRASLDGDRLALGIDPVAIAVQDLVVQRTDARKPLLSLRSLELSGGRIDPAAHTVSIGELKIADGQFAAHLDRAGALDWNTLLVEAPADTSGAPSVPAADPPWQLRADAIRMNALKAEVLDASRHARLAFSLLARRAEFAATLELGADGPRTTIADGSAELAEIVLSSGSGKSRERLGRIARIGIEGAAADVSAQRLSATRIAVTGLDASIHREAGGEIREIELVSTPDPATPLPVSSAAAEWQLALGELAFDKADLSYTDATLATPPLAITTRGASLAFSDIRTGSNAPFGLKARFPLADGGEFGAEGTVSGDGSAAELGLTARAVLLEPFAPMVGRYTRLQLESGVLTVDARINLRAGVGGAPVLESAASLGIDDLLLTEQDSGERFLAWHTMSANGIDFGLAPDRLQVRELRIVEPGAKIVINKDRTTNLAGLIRETAAQPAQGDGEAAIPVMIDRIRIDRGTLDFADHGLVLPFAATIQQLSGTARGISSAEDSRATLKLAGRVGEFGEAEIDGQLTPFDLSRYTDVEVSFRNIGMGQLSPYSATFAGRRIAAGDLDLGLEYQVSDGVLSGENQLLLQDFRLGENVTSPRAMDLPLDLAIALLTDAEGRIDLTVPVSGNVGDPQFDYGKLIGKALRTSLSNLVSAPFRALGAAFSGNGGDDRPPAIRFLSGSTTLMPREQERLAQIAVALAERPQLALVVTPGIEPERDGYAARRLLVRRAHAGLLDIELEDGEDPGAVSYDAARSQRALERLIEEREGDGAAERFAQSWSARSGKDVHHVNAALALLGKGAGDPAYYRELYLHLVNSTPEPREALDQIAAGRAETVLAELKSRGVDPSRLRIGGRKPLVQARPTGVLVPLGLSAPGAPKAGKKPKRTP